MAGRFSKKIPGAHKSIPVGGGKVAISTGRDDSSYSIGNVREINDSNGAIDTDYDKSKSMGGASESDLKRGYS